MRFNRLILFSALALVLALLATPVPAADFQQALDAYNRADYATAFKAFRTLAEQGHANAQNNLGVLYQNGQGTAQDLAAAAYWYRQAAEQGVVDAQVNLGALYVEGQGVSENYQTAYAWFSRAAAQGDGEARKHRDFIADQLTPAELAAAKQMAAARPSTPVAQAAQPAQPAPASPPPVQAASAPAAAAPAAAPSSPRFYGPVAPRETLWSIAKQLQPDASLSVQQIMLALLYANPEAFSPPTINGLKAGARLRVPAPEEIRRLINQDQARVEVQRQLQQNPSQ